MITRIVETQSDLDAALADSDVATIRICSPAGVPMRLSSSGWATVRACGSAIVEASGSAIVRADDSTTVWAYDSTTVWASGSAIVFAYDWTTVTARDSCTITAGPHVAIHLHSTRATVTGGIIVDLTDSTVAQ